ncbi:hypothetical protein WH390_11295 [Candidatus Arsenophonus nilaparvatae]|uniref:hypothetical protein n=1 Tax=Candidatus Arsenophonus nilaparvatae TaxID=1247023 RepID=UPI0005096812|nr:hypothetical protein [Candidatus Arsenophonus nilaparvatae]
MSFWSDFADGFTSVYTKYLPGLFTGDTYFPDNPVREARAHEIAVDCQTYASKNALLIKEIQNNVVELNNHLKELYQKEINDEEIKFEKFSFDTLNFEIPTMLAPIITANIVSESITVGATSYLVSTGEIGAAALVELVGLPASFEIASMAASGGATIGVVLAIGSVVGKIKRDKLQKAIHDGYQSRYKLAKAANINHSISQSIKVINASISELKEIKVPFAAIEEHISVLIEKQLNNINENSQSSTIVELQNLDVNRGSWTDEDGSV